MTLNLKTFVGCDKIPYCQAHGPSSKLKPTAVTETPEWRRIQRNKEMRALQIAQAEAEALHEQMEFEYSQQKQKQMRAGLRAAQPAADDAAVFEELRRSRHAAKSSVSSNGSSSRESTPKIAESLPEGQGQGHQRNKSKGSTHSSVHSDDGHGGSKQQKQKQQQTKVAPTQAQAPVAAVSATHAANVEKTGLTYKAIYEHDAGDVDEVSFVEGDLIIDCTDFDQGWLTGTVQRTGKRGMLPANYVIYVHST
jgi:hypothetical protein